MRPIFDRGFCTNFCMNFALWEFPDLQGHYGSLCEHFWRLRLSQKLRIITKIVRNRDPNRSQYMSKCFMFISKNSLLVMKLPLMIWPPRMLTEAAMMFLEVRAAIYLPFSADFYTIFFKGIYWVCTMYSSYKNLTATIIQVFSCSFCLKKTKKQ